MSDEELFKAIKEYSENNKLDKIREANIILRKIRDTCKLYPICNYCPYYSAVKHCIVTSDTPQNWEI